MGFYLMDSIVKNVKGSYIAHFQRNLADLFLSTFTVADANMQRSMTHLYDTWRSVFAQGVLNHIERALPPRPQKQMQPQQMQMRGGADLVHQHQPPQGMMMNGGTNGTHSQQFRGGGMVINNGSGGNGMITNGGGMAMMQQQQQPTGNSGYHHQQQPTGLGMGMGGGVQGMVGSDQQKQQSDRDGGYTRGRYGALPPPQQQHSIINTNNTTTATNHNNNSVKNKNIGVGGGVMMGTGQQQPVGGSMNGVREGMPSMAGQPMQQPMQQQYRQQQQGTGGIGEGTRGLGMMAAAVSDRNVNNAVAGRGNASASSSLSIQGMDPAAAGSLLATMVQGGGDISALLKSIAAAKAGVSLGARNLLSGGARESSPALNGNASGGGVGSPTSSGVGAGPPPPRAPPGKPSARAVGVVGGAQSASGGGGGGRGSPVSAGARADRDKENSQPRRLTADFDPATEHGEEGELRKRREHLIDAMYTDRPHQCAQTGRRFTERGELDAHLDLMHMRRRRKKEGTTSRRWCVDADSWIAGARAEAADDAPAYFANEAAAAAAVEAAKACSVLVDESQPDCALSGEPFEVFWNAEEDEWHYRSAVRLEASVGAVPAGAIVLVSAVPKGDGEGMLAALAEVRAVADDLAQAAEAAETMEPETEDAATAAGNKRKAEHGDVSGDSEDGLGEDDDEEEEETEGADSDQQGSGKRQKS